MHLGATSVLTSVSPPVAASPNIPQRTQRRISEKNDTPTITTVTTIRTTTRHELLSSEAHGSRATIASSNPDLSSIDHSS
jgi:hypothetical protein